MISRENENFLRNLRLKASVKEQRFCSRRKFKLMRLRIRKLVISLGILFVISLVVAVFFRGSIFASDVILTNNNSTSTVIDKLSFPSQFTFSPLSAREINMGKDIQVSKAYRIYDSNKIYGELILAGNSDCSRRAESEFMISYISQSYPFITRDRYKTGSAKDAISYREWGTARKDGAIVNYQNIIIHDNNYTCYLILYYNGPYDKDINRIIKSVTPLS